MSNHSDGTAATTVLAGDKLMIELLSGQASIEAKEYKVMEWDAMQKCKKEHALLATKINSLTRSLTLETRLRDSALKLVRLSESAATARAANPTSPPRPSRVTKEQAEAQLATASAKMETVSVELYKVGWEEAKLRTKLLQHTAGVLALAAKQKEDDEAAKFGERVSSPSPSRGGANHFDGASFFAGNREAINPHGRLSPLSGSPSLGMGGFSSLPPDTTRERELETQLNEVQTQLAQAQADLGQRTREASGGEAARLRLEEETSRISMEAAASRKAEQTAREEAKASRRDAMEARRELIELRKELNTARESVASATASRSSVGGLEKEEADELNRRMDRARQDREEANAQLEEMRSRLEESERQASDLASDLTRERSAREDDVKRLNADVAAASSRGDDRSAENELRLKVNKLQDDRSKLTQSIGDVLRRHRTRAATGSVLRELPIFDDTSERDDLAQYVSATIDSHFDKLSTHVSGVSKELESVSNDYSTAQANAESHLRAKDALEVEHTNLKRELASRSGAAAALEQNLANAGSEHNKLQQELALANQKTAQLEAQTAEYDKKMKPLQELWKQVPAIDSRQAAAGSDDLSVLKKAFELPNSKKIGNFLADLGAKADAAKGFTVEALAERIRQLMAEDVKLVNKLIAFESEKDTHKANADKANKSAAEATASASSIRQQLAELEERLEGMSQQEVTMLERLNDLTESLESTRGDKRKAENNLNAAQGQLDTVQKQHAALQDEHRNTQQELAKLVATNDSAKMARLENSISDLKDQVDDLSHELDDVKQRENKQRAQLLAELSEVQSECAGLKTKLRQAERKATGGSR